MPKKDTLKLEKGVNYFVSLIPNRYVDFDTQTKKALEQEFGGIFEPILITTTQLAKPYSKQKNLLLRKEEWGEGIYLPETTELTKIFTTHPDARRLMRRLVKRQGRVFINPFSTINLHIDIDGVTVIGPDSKLTTMLDSKKNQVDIFNEAKVPTPEILAYYPNPSAVVRDAREGKLNKTFLQSEYGSGGTSSACIRNKQEALEFIKRTRKIGKKVFISRRLVDTVDSPSCNALIDGEGKVHIFPLLDQLLDGPRHYGNVYPSKINNNLQKEISRQTVQVGRVLSKKGYKGMFGLDFVIDKKNNVFAVDLNPRKQSGLGPLAMMFGVMFGPKNSVAHAELRAVLGKKAPKGLEKLKKADNSRYWAFGRVKLSGLETNIEKGKREKIFDKSPFGPRIYASTIQEPAAMSPKSPVYPSVFTVVSGSSREKVIKALRKEHGRAKKKAECPSFMRRTRAWFASGAKRLSRKKK